MIMQPSQGSKPFQQAIVHFQQHYNMMKSYLKKVFFEQDRKKRFTFVYEQCLKFYTKNNASLCNHEVLKLIKMFFYVLKKKMIARRSSETKLTLERVYELYSMMTNVYTSWQAVMMTQMTVEEPAFFSMLFRMREYQNEKGVKVSRMIDNLILKPKPDFVVTSKINLEYKTYNFFKQLLRMTINSILVMIPCLKTGQIQRLVETIKKGQKIMKQFEQHIFPVQKIQFYLLKCQIFEWASHELGLCLNFSFKYDFPIGLFQLIYKNLKNWKDGKVMHYANMLMKTILISGRNQLLNVKDIYILSMEIELLMKAIKKNDIQTEQQFVKDNKGQRNSKFVQMNKKVNNSQPFSSKNYVTQGKAGQLTVLNAILMEIDQYLTQLKEINHIISYYMRQEYHKYKNFDPKDELMDEIPVLVGQRKKINKKKSQNNNYHEQRFRQHFSNSKSKEFYPKGEDQKGKDYRTNLHFIEQDNIATGYDGRLWEEKRNKSLEKKKQGEKQKGREIIIKNIMNVKVRKKRLTLGDKKDNSVMTRMGTLMSTTLSQQRMETTFKNKFDQAAPKRLHQTLQNAQLPSLTPSLKEPVLLLQQSSSDQQEGNELKYKFETLRRQRISSVNSKYYNATNTNYLVNNDNNDEENDENCDSSKFEGESRYIINGENKMQNSIGTIMLSNVSNRTKRVNRVSEEIQYDQIKMLDDVIKDKVLTLLDVEIQSTENNSIRKKQLTSTPPFLNNYSTTKLLTSKLLQQVKQLNRQQKLLTQQLKGKMTNKSLFKYTSQHQLIQTHGAMYYSNELIRDFEDIYTLKTNMNEKAHSYEQLYRKLLNIDDQSINNKKPTRNKLSSTFKHYANIHRQYNTNATKLSIIGEAQEEEQQSQLTQRELQQHIKLTEFMAYYKPQSMNEKTLERQQRQLKFNNRKVKEIFISQGQHGTEGRTKQVALRQEFNNLSVDVSRSRFNSLNLFNNNNANTLLLKPNNEQDLT